MKPQVGLTVASVVATLVLAAPGTAGEPGQRAPATGNVVVNEVTVRDVQVREARAPSSARPSTAIPRPFLPDAISRPNQSHFESPPDRTRGGHSRRPRAKHASGLIGYPIGFPVYPFIAQPAYTFYDPPSYTAVADWSAPRLVAGNPWFAAIDCGTAPGASAPCGGLSFDVLPADAQVSVEGVFVGSVDAFAPAGGPLVLSPGVHYVEVRRPGYRTEAFEVTIGAGAIVPYQGALEPLRTR
jgi:hypothetical protein